MNWKKISIVIPVYNEEKTLAQLLNRIEAVDLGLEKEIIIVNDASTDSSAEIIAELTRSSQYRILTHTTNKGKSQSVKDGIVASTGDLVVIQDADLEYSPHDLRPFVELFHQGEVDVVYGNRFNGKNKVIYWHNWIGNRALSLFSALFTGPRAGMWTSDMEVCYKMAEGNLFRAIAATVESVSNFGLEPELTAKFARYKFPDGRHVRWQQLPVSYQPRTIAEGKHMNAFRDGGKALIEILKFNLS
jgi:glycosyltransferase involved in cell wall biosynthesis